VVFPPLRDESEYASAFNDDKYGLSKECARNLVFRFSEVCGGWINGQLIKINADIFVTVTNNR
jgi:hypothetical protein